MSRPAPILRVVDPAGTCASLRIGEIVRTGENRYPLYEIIAVRDGRAWIRNVQHGDDHVVPIAKIHRVYPDLERVTFRQLRGRIGRTGWPPNYVSPRSSAFPHLSERK
jgi:hypothetical protein